MRKIFVAIACTISFVIGIGFMYVINDYLLHEKSLASYAKALALKSEKKYSEALLSACDSVTWNQEDYSPLILMADIVSLEGKTREVSREIYAAALDIARRNITEQRSFDIKRLQEKIEDHQSEVKVIGDTH